MKALSKTFEPQRLQLIDELAVAESEVESAIEKFNGAMESYREDIEAAVSRYNEAIQNAVALRDEAQQEVQDYFDEKSEKWQESEKGSVYQTWIDNLNGLELEEIEVELPSPVEVPGFGAKDELEQNWQGEA